MTRWARLDALVRFYMRQYGYTHSEAIQSIKADLKDLANRY